MNNPSDKIIGQAQHSQAVNRRTFLEVTAGLFAAYSGSSLRAESLGGGGAAVDAGARKIETPSCVLRLEPDRKSTRLNSSH